MELQLVTFEQAKILKDLGFPQSPHIIKADGLYLENGEYISLSSELPEKYYICTSQALVAKWLRDEKNINIMISNYDGRMAGHLEVAYMYIMNYIKPIKNLHNCYTMYNSYEDALSAGISKALEILNTY